MWYPDDDFKWRSAMLHTSLVEALVSKAATFSAVQLEALAKAIARELTAADIGRRLDDIGMSLLPNDAARTKWLVLSEALQLSQDIAGEAEDVLRFIGLAMQSVYLSGTTDQQTLLCANLNRVLSTAGFVIEPDGTVSRMLPNF